MRLTPRQRITHREYRRGKTTQLALAQRFGVTRSAIAMRLARRRARLAKANSIIEYAPLSSVVPQTAKSVQLSAVDGLY